ncbi:MAG: Bax inhibitor-1/YccA family protein [Hyphomicrobiaceae bacterium]|nr:Bax inhibitor-1/YccA family protein [Hyphomicrobiaceae bacterium]
MAQMDRRYQVAGTATREVGRVDEGLRSYMLGVYNYMAAGVALTGAVAYGLFHMLTTTDRALAAAQLKNGIMLTEAGKALYTSPLMWVVALAPLAFIFLIGFRAHKMSLSGAQMTFWAFAAVMGASLSSIFLRYTGASITQMFFVTAAAFSALSLWGYTTRKDLTGWGSFLFMGVVGIIIAGLVNIFLQSSALQFAISSIGVLVFAGLTAYDTQRIKDEYYLVAGDAVAAGKAAIFGALSLYLDFVNMFVSLLQLFGNRE